MEGNLDFTASTNAFAAIDLAAAAQRVNAAAAVIEELEETIEHTTAQMRELDELLEERRRRVGDGPDGVAIAEALLAGGNVDSVSEELDGIRSRRDALRAGLVELNRSLGDARSRVRDVRLDILREVGAAADLAADDLEIEIRAATDRLLELHAVAGALGAVKARRCAHLRNRLDPAIQELSDASLADRGPTPVPAYVKALLANAEDLIKLCKGGVPSHVARAPRSAFEFAAGVKAGMSSAADKAA